MSHDALNGEQFQDHLSSGYREHWSPGEKAHLEYHCYEGHQILLTHRCGIGHINR